MTYLLIATSCGITITTGFNSHDLALRAKKRALANGATYAHVMEAAKW